jgi:hypothetical protein
MTAKLTRNIVSNADRGPLLVVMRCYFNLVNGHEKIIDQDGIEVRDIEQARVQALKAIDELREEDGASMGDWHDWSLEVTDASGTVFFSINLGAVLH